MPAVVPVDVDAAVVKGVDELVCEHVVGLALSKDVVFAEDNADWNRRQITILKQDHDVPLGSKPPYAGMLHGWHEKWS